MIITRSKNKANKRKNEKKETEEKKKLKINNNDDDNESDFDSDDEETDDESFENELAKKIIECLNNSSSNTFENSLSEKEHEFYFTLTDSEKTNMEKKYDHIININDGNIPNKFKILESDIDDNIKYIALQKQEAINQLEDSGQSEYFKMCNWMNAFCDIPFNKTIPMPVTINSKPNDISKFINDTKNIFDNEIYGHKDAKDQIIRIIGQWISNPSLSGHVIGIHGNPGVGKTTLVKQGICKALNLPFMFIPLGGAQDGSYLDGHSYTYEGSTWGKIADCIMKSKCMNPVLYFDELDKVSDTSRGQEIINILIHLTDSSQNDKFSDKYFSDIHLDLSKCLIIFTYNNDNLINPILKDRMITIHTKDYNKFDKMQILNKHLLPSIKKDFNISSNIDISDDNIYYLIERTKSEAGVRNLKRSLETIISNINLENLLNNSFNQNLIINKDIIDKYIKNNNDINPSISHLYL